MRKITKIFIFTLLGVLLAQNSPSAVVFAQETEDSKEVECLTCKMPSLEFQTYINFQVELLQVLARAVRQDEKKESNTTAWLFSAGILSIPKNLLKTRKTMFNKAWKDVVDAAQSVKMWSIMLASITTELWKDGAWGLALLFNIHRNDPFVRERSTLQDIDMSIHDAMWDLWSQWLWDENISSEVMGDITKLQQKYTSNVGYEYGLFEQNKFNINWSIKYKNMVNIMLRLNSIMKNFIAIDSKRIDDKIIEQSWITMQFNKKLMDRMYVSYDCAEGISACNDMWSDLAKNTKVWSSIKSGFDNSMETINKANEKLWQSMLSIGSSTKDTFSDKSKNDESWLTSEQKELLRMVYGIDTTKLSKEQWIWLEQTVFAVTHPRQAVNNISLKPLDYFSAEAKALRQQARKESEQQKQNIVYLAEFPNEEKTESENRYADLIKIENLLARDWPFNNEGENEPLSVDVFFSELAQDTFLKINISDSKLSDKNKLKKIKYELNKDLIEDSDGIALQDSLQQTLNSVLAQKQEDKWVFMIYSNISVTRYFVDIGKWIHNIIDEDIWTKDSKWWLVNSLWESCESQCSNKGNENCYAK